VDQDTLRDRVLRSTSKDDAEQQELLRRIRQRLADQARLRGISEGDQTLRALAQQIAQEELREAGVNYQQQQRLLAEVLAYVGGGYGPLQQLVSDPEVEEVMVNRHDEVWVYRRGAFQRTDVRFRDDSEVVTLVQRMVAAAGRQFNFANPIVDARLPDGSRLNAVLSGAPQDGTGGVSSRGTAVTLRRVVARPSFEDLVAQGAIPEGDAAEENGTEEARSFPQTAAEFLAQSIRRQVSLLVVGGMASGKTTYLNAFLRLVPEEERIIIVEDVGELNDPVPNVVRLEARRPNAEGEGGIGLPDLVNATLRMRPTRIVVGEVRSLEAGPMITAMTVGHPGSMGTMHADGPLPALHRLEGLVRSATGFDAALSRAYVAEAIRLIVFVGFLRGRRRILEIAALDGLGADGDYAVIPIFTWRGGAFVPTGNSPAWWANR
jgi:pilus assembly protein CpaF